MDLLIGQYILIGFVLFLVGAPMAAKRILDNLIDGEPILDNPAMKVEYVVPAAIVQMVNCEATLDSDTLRLAAVRKAVETSQTANARYIWLLQEARLLREMKWRAVAADTQGTTLQNGVRK